MGRYILIILTLVFSACEGVAYPIGDYDCSDVDQSAFKTSVIRCQNVSKHRVEWCINTAAIVENCKYVGATP